MPWPRKQAIAIMLKAQKEGDSALENKAKGYLKGKGMGDQAASKPRKRPRPRRRMTELEAIRKRG